VGVLGLFHALEQTIDNQLALSADGGQSWWRPARRPNVPLRPLGEWGSGLIWPFRSLVTDAADAATLHMYFSGTEGLHGDLLSTLPAEVLAAGLKPAAGTAPPPGAGAGTWSWSPIRSYAGLPAIITIGARQYLQQQRVIGHGGGHGPNMIDGYFHTHNTAVGYQPMGRLHAHDARKRRRYAD
jgi:hypothetical protein